MELGPLKLGTALLPIGPGRLPPPSKGEAEVVEEENALCNKLNAEDPPDDDHKGHD